MYSPLHPFERSWRYQSALCCPMSAIVGTNISMIPFARRLLIELPNWRGMIIVGARLLGQLEGVPAVVTTPKEEWKYLQNLKENEKVPGWKYMPLGSDWADRNSSKRTNAVRCTRTSPELSSGNTCNSQKLCRWLQTCERISFCDSRTLAGVEHTTVHNKRLTDPAAKEENASEPLLNSAKREKVNRAPIVD